METLLSHNDDIVVYWLKVATVKKKKISPRVQRT